MTNEEKHKIFDSLSPAKTMQESIDRENDLNTIQAIEALTPKPIVECRAGDEPNSVICDVSIPEIVIHFTATEVKAHERKLKQGIRIYTSEELVKDSSHFDRDMVPYNDTFRYPDCLTKIDDLKIGDVIYNHWYDGTIYKGAVEKLNGDHGYVKYDDRGSLRGMIEFSKDDRHCWCQNGWIAIDPSIDLESELINTTGEQTDVKKNIDQ